MTRRDDLIAHIRDSYALIHEYEEIARLSGDPKEIARARREMTAQWKLVHEWLVGLQQLGGALPPDVAEIAIGTGAAAHTAGAEGTAAMPAGKEGVEGPGTGPAATPDGGAGRYHIHVGQAQGIAIGDGARVELAVAQSPRPAGGDSGGDIYARYLDGVERLLQELGSTHPRLLEALILQQRLTENISQTRLYGDTENRRAQRAEVVGRLNALASETIGQSFNDLAG